MSSDLAPIDAQDAVDRIREGAVVLDVRGRRPERKIEGAIRVDKTNIENLVKPGSAQLLDLDRLDEHIVVYCGSEQGSAQVANYLNDLGFRNVAHVRGGFDALNDTGSATVALSDDEI